MSRLTFPSDRLVYKASAYAGSGFTSAAGSTATVYSDSAGTTLADVQQLDGTANPTATFTVDPTSRLPLFLGPASGTDTLYVKIDNGPVTPIYAVTSGDISAAVGAEVTNRTAADAAHVAASNPHNVTPALIGAENVVIHGSTAGTARPAGATVVHWIGSVAPSNVATNDEWTDTTNKILKRWNGTSFDSLGSAASALSALTDVNVTGVVDGQLMAYQASSSKWVPVNPTGNAEIAYSENGTGTVTGPVSAATGAFGTAVAVPNTDIVVPVSARPVYLDGYILAQQTTAGTGMATIEIWETTGTPAVFDRVSLQLPNSTSNDPRSRIALYHPPIRLGAVASQRSFQLRINGYGNSATIGVEALNTNAVGFKSWLRAMAA